MTKTKYQDDFVENVDFDTLLWTKITDRGEKKPTARRGHTLTLSPASTRHVVLIGGEDTVDDGSPFSFYLDTGTWEWYQLDTRGRAPPSSMHATVRHGDCLVVSGGFGGGERAVARISTLTFPSLEWEQAPCSLPHAVSCHTATRVGSRMYVIGGRRRDSTATDAVQTVHLRKWKGIVERCGGEGPPPLHGHAAAAIGEDIFVFGGWTSEGGRRMADMYRLDTRSLAWDKLDARGDVPVPRSGHVMCAFGDRYLVVHGGTDDYRALKDTYVFDTYDLEWFKVDSPSEKVGISGHAIVPYECRDFASFVLVGGTTEVSSSHPNGFVSDVYLGDIEAYHKGFFNNGNKRSISERTGGMTQIIRDSSGRRKSVASSGGLFSTGWISSLWGGNADFSDEYYGDDDWYADGYETYEDNDDDTDMREFISGRKSASEVLGMAHSFERIPSGGRSAGKRSGGGGKRKASSRSTHNHNSHNGKGQSSQRSGGGGANTSGNHQKIGASGRRRKGRKSSKSNVDSIINNNNANGIDMESARSSRSASSRRR